VQESKTEAGDDDAALARRIMAAGPARDRQAEALLYGSLAPRVRLYGLRHLRSPEGAADLVQDVLLMTLQRLGRGEIREPERIASFVLGACRQMVIDQRRGQRRRERLLDVYSDDVPLADAAPAATLDAQRLEACLEHLPERERTVVLMTFYDESPAATVAQQLRVSPANVRVIRHRAIERLRRCVEGAGP
jgi:RNA polymerase sigma-70 factor (ECF subfamily)